MRRVFPARQTLGVSFALCAALILCCPATPRTQATVRQTKFASVTTPVFTAASRECKTDDSYMSEGDELGKVCPGSGKYKLLLSGAAARVNYGIVVPKTDFAVYLHPLEQGAAENFVRADLYDEKIGSQIEWRMADGVPFAVIVRMAFYKNTGRRKNFANPKSKAAEFIFVRGLRGFEDLQEDLTTTDTAYDAQEQAHKIADEFYEQKRK